MKDLKGRVSTLEITVEKLSQKVDDAIAESRADRAEMKKEIRAINQRMDAKFEAMSQKMDTTLKNIQNLTVAAMVGIGAAVFGVGGIAIAVISFVLNK